MTFVVFEAENPPNCQVNSHERHLNYVKNLP